jgi:rubrerythrin
MIQNDIKSIMELLSILAKTESAIADFYDACGQMWPEEREFWESLVRDERGHADVMQRMANIIYQKQDVFRVGRKINSIAVKTFNRSIEENRERCLNGNLPRERMLFIARDIERSLIEEKFHEIVTTDDLEYRSLSKTIVDETAIHKNLIDKKIKEHT